MPEQLLYIGFGWLLGLLAPAIVERIRKSYQRAELTVAIKTELHELQYKMALLSHELNRRLAMVTDAHLSWLQEIVHNYAGPNPKTGILNGIAGLRQIAEKERCQILAQLRDPKVGVGLMQYSIPFITAHMADVSLYPVPFQSAVIRIKDQLDMFNQRVSHLQKLHDRTFDTSLTDLNRTSVISDLEKGYQDLARQSAFIADAISILPTQK